MDGKCQSVYPSFKLVVLDNEMKTSIQLPYLHSIRTDINNEKYRIKGVASAELHTRFTTLRAPKTTQSTDLLKFRSKVVLLRYPTPSLRIQGPALFYHIFSMSNLIPTLESLPAPLEVYYW
jgi:hypothetical protein